MVLDKFGSCDVNEEVTLYRVLKEFDYLLNVNYDENEVFSLIPGKGRNHEDFRVHAKEWSREAIENQAKEIKARIMKDVDRIINTNTLNLAVTALYPKFYRAITVDRGNEYFTVEIFRNALLDPIELKVYVYTKNEEEDRKKYAKMVLNVSGVSKEIIMYHDEERSGLFESFGYNEYSNIDGFLSFENRDIIKDRLDRIRKGDFSVMDEVIKENEDVVESIVQQLKEQKIEYVDGNYDRIRPIQININVLDFVPEKQKQELLIHLVAEKIKNSVQKGGN